ncbi:hypothetical protein [Aliiglaciecola sp. LCG003]|uniref:hypothetical protein n=1 Tax=Aliiglaciecola sp. LCG003 TaxID=3053655 RepID=UPI002572FB36|nr:hypothetical protein [Aliiglaciecola sp. LCG003]WJG08944.1 hypothetical protein QR722_16670 [Aliiglaciecola sp. LCG003]
MRPVLIFFALVLSSPSIFAEQLKFVKNVQGNSIAMSYLWLDQFNQTHEITFSLDKDMTHALYSNQTNYKPDIAQRYVYVELMKQAQQINPREARVNVIQRGSRLEFKVSSRSNEMLAKWRQLMSDKQNSAFQQYLTDNHYSTFTDYSGQTGVVPDHLRYVKESHSLMLPVAQAIYDKLNPGSDTRDYVNLLLSWIQSIPYDALENRISSNGAGFFTPVEVLINNRGDCDSKATLTAALMRSLLPELSMAIVYLPGHALLAVNLSHRIDEHILTIAGTDHVLIEPTGPAKVSIGRVSDETARHIANGSYTYILVP